MRVQHFSQSHDSLDMKKSALDHCYDIDMLEQKARSFLANLLFEQGEMTAPVEKLSGGQKSRLRFALMFAQQPELLILDEPTNNLDPTTWWLLLGWLRDYQGSILLISHDRRFLEEFKFDSFWVVNKGTIRNRHKDLPEILKEIQ